MFGLTYKQQDELAEFIAERIEESGPLLIKEIFHEFTREQVKRIAKNEVKQ